MNFSRTSAPVVPSPVTGAASQLAHLISAEKVRARYQLDMGLDVGDHLPDGDLKVFRCRDTGYRFFHPASLAGEGRFYDQLHAGGHLEDDEISERPDWNFALQRIRPTDRVLDIGCSSGGFLALVKASATGIDESKEGVDKAVSRGLDARRSSAKDEAARSRAAYDVVCSFQCLEHVYDVAAYLRSVAELLAPGGRAGLSTLNCEPYYAGWAKFEPLNNPPHHIGLWSRRSMERAAALFGLRLTAWEGYGDVGSFALRVFRRAAFMTGVWRRVDQLTVTDKMKVLAAAPIAAALTAGESPTTAYMVAEFRPFPEREAQRG